MLNKQRIKYIKKLKEMSDNVSIQRIAKCHPKLRSDLADILLKIQSKNINIRITQGLRTFAEQDALYAQGRTTSGSKVTNAKGGDSMHNFGIAVDFCLLHKDGTISFKMDEDMDKDNIKDWDEVVGVFKEHGWSWGGDWKSFKDTPHFEKTFGYTLSQIKLLHKDKEGYPII